MTKMENLFIVAQEECAEISQNIAKALRFGVDNHHPDAPKLTNGYEILKEYAQLQAAMDQLIVREHLTPLSETERKRIYREKVAAIQQWEEYSQSIGRIQ